MSVSNGQQANSTTFNNAFMSRTANDNTTGKKDLENTDPASGSNISNVQRELNKLNSFLGSTANTAFDSKPSWTSNDVGVSTDDVKLRADLVTAKFNSSTGHAHSGGAGDGALISAANLANFNKFWAEWQTDVFASAAGLSDDVTSVFSAETPGGGASAVGVPTSAPYNRVELRTDPSEDQVEEPGGRLVYGRLTESSGTWTLTYYYLDSLGVETAYSLPTQDIRIYWREVFDSSNRPTFGTQTGFIGSQDATRDVIDASATESGKVNLVEQHYSGLKVFEDGLVAGKMFATESQDIAGGGSITSLNADYSFVRITGASATTIQGIAEPNFSNRLVIHNVSTADITLEHDSGSASATERLKLPAAQDITIASDSSAELIYDVSAQRWKIASAGTGGGGQGYQESLGNGDGVTTSFGPLTYTPTSADSIVVFLNGLPDNSANWSYSGGNIIFSTAPAAAQNVYVWYLTGGVSSPLPVISGVQKAEYRTLSAGEITAGQLTLANTPASAADTFLDVIGGTSQEYSVDFTVSGAVLSWSGLGLDGLLSAGDKLRVVYVY